MTIVRAVIGSCVIAFCAGFIPVGGCAKGCSSAGRAGASHADDFARVGVRNYGDDLARSGTRYGGGAGRYGDDLAYAGGRYQRGGVVVGGGGHVGDDMAHLSRTNMETTISTLPEAEGAVTSIARTPSSSGARLEGLDDAGRSFSKDYGASIDDLAITKKQHDGLMDAFETVQDLAQDAVETLLEDDDDSTPEKMIAATNAREKLQLVSLEFEASVAGILTPEQLRKFRAQFGSSEVIAYRLGKEKPVKRGEPAKTTKTKPATKRPAKTGDTVAP
jgi:hypothetical protein